jgi:hypothetical protein
MNPPTGETSGGRMVDDDSFARSRFGCRHFRKVTDVRA